MYSFKWWHLIFNINFIAFVAIMAAVAYCVWTGNGLTRGKFKFRGLGESGFDLYNLRKPQKKRRKKNKHEERCREIFEKIFDEKFKSVRPDWLKNPATGKNLELDGYCSHIQTKIGKGLAFEYDGAQHSKYNRHFHGNNPKKFIYQVKRDSWKDLRCEEEKVLLIRIPHLVAFQDLERYIKGKLKKHGLERSSDGFLGGLYD